MSFTQWCAFVLFFYLSSIDKTQSYDFDACPSSVNGRLNVTYGSLVVTCNAKYDRDLVTSPPKLTFSRADRGKFYEILMIDPDAPSATNHRCRSWLHMILSDVKGSDLQKGIFASDNGPSVLTEYKPPTPPKGSSYHRYILTAFSHTEPLKLEKIEKRCQFDIDSYTKGHQLHQTPDASNMFQTITD